MKRTILSAFVLVALVGAFVAAPALADVNIGVLAKRGAPQCMQQWGATGQYLSEKLGTPVKIVPLKFEAIKPSVESGQVDFVLANSAFYVELEKEFGCRAVATLVNSRNGNALKEFGGVVFVKADSPITTLADIKGKKFMVVKKSSFGGAQMAWRLLKENGIDPETDCAEFLFGNKHDNVVLAVRNGACDAGSVRSDTLERMADEGKISMDEFRVINKVDDDFPFVHSTRLYPEWPLAACKSADPAVVAQVVQALLALQPTDTAAQSAKIVGWTEPLDYGPVRECLTIIQYGTFAGIQ
ncbi:phosphate/phosphite/phosphonate ABC transporter substrate-binding protein [bacterium]|nr:phosphate/phosphite/phosphonate ABC transporter substrate-binding protein [bacterium]